MKTVQIPIRGGLQIEPEIVDIYPCLISDYYKQTNSFGYPYVMVIEEEDENKKCD